MVRPTVSKHLGLFPEQAPNWEWIKGLLSREQTGEAPPRVLNLFGYTGGATLAAAAAGASVTHVDAAKAMVTWCSENARLSGLGEKPIRYIVDDALAFLQKEVRRGNRYEGIVMDPPSYGRGKGGTLWKLADHLPLLLGSAVEALSDRPLFLLLNTYSPEMDMIAGSIVADHLSVRGGGVRSIGLGLTGTLDGRHLPAGMAHRWVA
jgi:23S rRNA (cytosine1962-C5)-methyltransferase